MSEGNDPKKEPVRREDIRALHARIKGVEERMREELTKKQDAAVFEVQLEQLKGPHQCTQEAKLATMTLSMSSIGEDIREIKRSLSRGRRVKWGGAVAVILAAISAAVFVARSSEKTDFVETSVQRIEEDISDMKDSSGRMEHQIEGLYAGQSQDVDDGMVIRKILREELDRGALTRRNRGARSTGYRLKQ